MLVLSALILLASQNDTDVIAFQRAFSEHKAEVPSKSVDPGIDRAMNILIGRLLLEPQKNVEPTLAKFARAVEGADSYVTSFSSVDGNVVRDRNRIAILVRMGAVSRLRLFDAKSQANLPLPATYDWRVGYSSIPHLTKSDEIIVDGFSIQDAGVRYGYIVTVLKAGRKGYVEQAAYQGGWVLEDQGESHLRLSGRILTLKAIDEPKSFFTSSAEVALSSVRTVDLSGTKPRIVRQVALAPELRGIDRWMQAATTNPKTASERAFAKAYPSPAMLESWTIKGRTAILELDGLKAKFQLAGTGADVRVVGWTKM